MAKEASWSMDHLETNLRADDLGCIGSGVQVDIIKMSRMQLDDAARIRTRASLLGVGLRRGP